MPVAASSGVPTFSLEDAPLILSDTAGKPSSLTGFGVDWSGAVSWDLLPEPLTRT